jgi:hypothetical protein
MQEMQQLVRPKSKRSAGTTEWLDTRRLNVLLQNTRDQQRKQEKAFSWVRILQACWICKTCVC